MAGVKGRNGKSPRASEDAVPSGEIAQTAYELFQQRGGAHGQDQEDWFEAERIIRARRQARSSR